MITIVGCALSAPDRSSPRGYSRMFFGYSLINLFFFIVGASPYVFHAVDLYQHISILVEYMHLSNLIFLISPSS
jgi:hypothetical protein